MAFEGGEQIPVHNPASSICFGLQGERDSGFSQRMGYATPIRGQSGDHCLECLPRLAQAPISPDPSAKAAHLLSDLKTSKKLNFQFKLVKQDTRFEARILIRCPAQAQRGISRSRPGDAEIGIQFLDGSMAG